MLGGSDLAINTIRMWHRDGATDMQTHALLLSTSLRAVERVSARKVPITIFRALPGTQEPRTLWHLELLLLDGVIGGVGGH